MPVDEANLATVKGDIEVKLQANRIERGRLQSILINITNIEQVDDDSVPPVKVIPQDRGAGGPYTPARRNDVYDKIVSDHAAL